MATLDRPDCPSVNNLFDDNGRTALHLAALGGHKECLKELLRRRANPNIQDKDGHTASHVLVLGGAPARFSSNNIVIYHKKSIPEHVSLSAWSLPSHSLPPS
jgi:hypothetical protein